MYRNQDIFLTLFLSFEHRIHNYGLTIRDAEVRFRTKVWTWTFQNRTKVWSKVQHITGLDQKSGPAFGQKGKILNLFELGPNWTLYHPRVWGEVIWLVDNRTIRISTFGSYSFVYVCLLPFTTIVALYLVTLYLLPFTPHILSCQQVQWICISDWLWAISFSE